MHHQHPNTQPPAAVNRRYGHQGARGELDKMAQAPQGFRHRTCYDAGYSLGQLHAGAALSDTDLAGYRRETVAMARQVGLTTRDAERAVANGITRGSQRPRQASGGADRPETVTAVVAWWQRADQDPAWRDRRGPTTRRIVAALAVLAAAAKTTSITDSYRTVAETAGVSVGTVHKHLARLARWVDVRPGSDGTHTHTTWTLKGVHFGNTPCPSPPGEAGVFPNDHDPLSLPNHDRWHHWSGGWAVYTALKASPDGASADDLARASGRRRRTVKRALAVFERWGVASHDGERWHRTGQHVPHETFWADRRRQTHARQRTVWAERLHLWAVEREQRKETQTAGGVRRWAA